MKNVIIMWYLTMAVVIAINLNIKYIIATFVIITIYAIFQTLS